MNWRCFLACAFGISIVCAASRVAYGEPLGVSAYVPADPAEDREALADLAPRANRATEAASYGDAAFAHAPPTRTARVPRGRRVRTCTGPTTDTAFKACPGKASRFFQRNYVFTPSYVSAPQVVEQERGAATPLLSPITGFFLDPLR